MKIMVTGAKGQLGSDLCKELRQRGIECIGVDIEEMDITKKEDCRAVIAREKPDAIIHCAAHTAVDRAEDEPDLVRRINAKGTENIAVVAGEMDIILMYISTDYVFDGTGERPWEPDDARSPLNVYGQMKYEGELAVEKLAKFFHRTDFMGVRSARQQFHQNDAAARQGKRCGQCGAGSSRFADLYSRFVGIAGGFDRNRTLWKIPCHK